MKEKRVKTKRVVKRRLKPKGVLILALVFASIILIVKTVAESGIKSIAVIGNDYVKSSEVIKLAGLNEDVTFLGFRASKACEKVENNPLIKSCKIKRSLDFKVEITIEENVPLFFYTTEDKIVLSDGTRIEPTSEMGIPTLINYVPEKELDEFISGLSAVDNDIIHSISEIEYAPTSSEDGLIIDSERFMMSMNDGNTVFINNRKLYILNYYDKIYATVGDKKGTYNFDGDFDNYFFEEYGD